MIAVVLDGSLTLSWAFEDEHTPELLDLRRSIGERGAVVPGLWWLEVGNALLVAERRKRTTTAKRRLFMNGVRDVVIETDPETSSRAWSHTVDLADTHRLTVYDAAYLELALRRGLPLASLDNDLRKAGRRDGVELLPKAGG